MLTIFRRHLKTCKHSKKGRKYRACNCPLAVEGTVHGETVRKSLDLRNWEAANKVVREWEIHGQAMTASVEDALDRWLKDCEARKLSAESLRKYKRLRGSMLTQWAGNALRSIAVDDVRKMRESWTFSAGTMAKQLELIRAFFSFCETSGWIDKNPAKRETGCPHPRNTSGSKKGPTRR